MKFNDTSKAIVYIIVYIINICSHKDMSNGKNTERNQIRWKIPKDVFGPKFLSLTKLWMVFLRMILV